jgi:hypothetical protein
MSARLSVLLSFNTTSPLHPNHPSHNSEWLLRFMRSDTHTILTSKSLIRRGRLAAIAASQQFSERARLQFMTVAQDEAERRHILHSYPSWTIMDTTATNWHGFSVRHSPTAANLLTIASKPPYRHLIGSIIQATLCTCHGHNTAPFWLKGRCATQRIAWTR